MREFSGITSDRIQGERGQEDCGQAVNQAKTATPGGYGSKGVGSDFGNSLRRRLCERRDKLQRELREVHEALETLDTDESVQKVLRVISVAEKQQVFLLYSGICQLRCAFTRYLAFARQLRAAGNRRWAALNSSLGNWWQSGSLDQFSNTEPLLKRKEETKWQQQQ